MQGRDIDNGVGDSEIVRGVGIVKIYIEKIHNWKVGCDDCERFDFELIGLGLFS